MARRLSAWVALSLACAAADGCTCGRPSDPLPAPVAADAGPDIAVLDRAEDMRRATDVPGEARTSRDPVLRRHATRALARIADDASYEGLLRALGDDDRETIAWAAHGLGASCKGREERVVRALGARGAALDGAAGAPSHGLDPAWAIARALGKCGGAFAEATLAAWVRQQGEFLDGAAEGLGDLAARRGTLGDDTVTVLLDSAEAGHAQALYPLGRAERVNDAFASRMLAAARKALTGPPSDARAGAIRALGRAGPDAAPALEAVVVDGAQAPADRAEAARALGHLGDAGHGAAASALARLVPDAKDAFAIVALGGPTQQVFVALLASLGTEPPKSAEASLSALANLRAPGTPPAPLARRLATLRCTSASLLARGAYDAEVLRQCDAPGTQAFEKARLASLLRRPMSGERRREWASLARSKNLRVREDAIEAVGTHPELGDAGRKAIAEALADVSHAGVVATAAETIHAHPERVMVLSLGEIRRALDPRAPAPGASPEQDVDPEVAKALDAALEHAFTEDLVETRVALVDAAAALGTKLARPKAKAACEDPNVTVRAHAMKALRALGDAKAACPAPAAMPLAKELLGPHGGTITFETDAGRLTITLDELIAPVTSTRIVDLAKAGFFKGIVVHRVVPGFVVQLGDPNADGYGGSGTLLRSETTPRPFGALDVGVALAGKDTGSSQLFVTLGRAPHLDGDYPIIGHAEGDWAALAEGDVITDVSVK